jgi:hypothetical protein
MPLYAALVAHHQVHRQQDVQALQTYLQQGLAKAPAADAPRWQNALQQLQTLDSLTLLHTGPEYLQQWLETLLHPAS